jgi:hypothetical protein
MVDWWALGFVIDSRLMVPRKTFTKWSLTGPKREYRPLPFRSLRLGSVARFSWHARRGCTVQLSNGEQLASEVAIMGDPAVS